MRTINFKNPIERGRKISEAKKGTSFTLEHREKLSKARKAFYANGGVHPRGMLGKKQTEEHKNKIALATTGEKHYNWKGGYANKLFHARQRSHRKRHAVGTHTFQEWNELKASFNFMCLCCKKSEPEIKLTEDHIMPLLMGGSNDISNIQPLCGVCNSRKNATTFDFRPAPEPIGLPTPA